MKILLLGGTGVMGSHLANILSDSTESIVITSRQYRENANKIEYRQGDAKDVEFLKNVLKERWDAIVDFMLYSEAEFNDRIDLLLGATLKYIFLSSARVYDCSEKPLTEESPRLVDSSTDDHYLQTQEYALLKARQEDTLRTNSKLNWVIVRPYITYSTKRLQLGTLEKENWLFRAMKGKTIVFCRDMLECKTTLTHGFDVANTISEIIKNPDSLGKTFHITNDKAVKWADVLNLYLDTIEEELGLRSKVILLNTADFTKWHILSKYQIIYDRLFDRIFDNTKIREFVSTTEFVDVQLGLKKCLLTFLKNPVFGDISWRSEADNDKITKERTPLKDIPENKQKLIYLVFRYFVNKNITLFGYQLFNIFLWRSAKWRHIIQKKKISRF